MGLAKRYDDLKVHLDVFGEDREIEAKVRVGPTEVTSVVDVARALTEGLVAIGTARVKATGATITCKKGCGSCCAQLVPVSPLEAVRVAELVRSMPIERRRAVRRRFAAAVKAMEEHGLVDPKAPRGRSALRSAMTDEKERWDDTSRRYFRMGVPCPFLEEGSCSIYAERPTVCREYSVTTPVSLCEALAKGIETVPRAVYMFEALTDLGNLALDREDTAMPLALALEWAEVHGGAFEGACDGEELVMALIEQVQAAADREDEPRPGGSSGG